MQYTAIVLGIMLVTYVCYLLCYRKTNNFGEANHQKAIENRLI